MLPINIYEMVKKLLDMTIQGQLSWDFDYYRDLVSAKLTYFDVNIMYQFDSENGVGYFHIDYYDKGSNLWHRFSTNHYYDDYSTVKRLYDEAQAKKLNIRF
ncbi:hypothetical protein [Pectobacterium carotovorum]|uniref:hypothetical protein n=1 Tax=Pectobacterium carotovorum TaxID=554 RepID=UPI002B24D12B|nr:hypothetical protein [Pectobacterium carotovorum]